MKRVFVVFITVLLLFTNSAFAATQFQLDDYSDKELQDIRKQIQEHFSNNKRGDLLYEDDNVAMYYLGWKKEYSTYELWVTFVNKTEKNLMVTAENSSVNDAACYVSSVFSVPSGKRTNDDIISAHETTLEEQWIEKIEYVEFSLRYYDEIKTASLIRFDFHTF